MEIVGLAYDCVAQVDGGIGALVQIDAEKLLRRVPLTRH